MEPFIHLAYDHFLLINDLYSFDREKRAADTHGATFTNVIHFPEEYLSVNPEVAKKVTLDILEGVECQLHTELQRLKESPTITETQLQYAFGTIENLSGNVLFSLTSKRYGGKAAVAFHLPPGVSRPGESSSMSKVVAMWIPGKSLIATA